MESIEKLRKRISNSTFSLNAMDDLFGLSDEIEAEIERDYMKLPVDVDGVPIHVGDEVEWINGNGRYKVCGVCGVGELVALRTHASDCFTISSNSLRHVKPRTLEDVLRDFIDEPFMWDGNREYEIAESEHNEKTIRRYADEIRELYEKRMRGDWS